ncbi:ubiquinol-cytochrome c reductase iron-sulfur subunit [Algoriphagus sediminis]|uniref:Rieske 2Fe-2S domain-containing protein n=1 Tax=Algoriphagus sediminis TaxID=3057113 RepID=A0ABT7YDM3_9BACT|nr:Rieske 2Fe-2S domain-containing protein [Algoriphagus sediminis]MDN3204566.1 Rieske 2Fe-2S domain-containing protein [Algoriphagus sediminis]
MEKITKTSTGQLTESRRKFIEKAGSGAVLALFGAAFFTSCSTTDDPDPNQPNNPGNDNGISVAGNTIRIDLGIQSGLNSDGSWLLIPEAQTLVANVGGGFIALTSVCTHSACDRNWTYSSEEFTCTCHNSKFDTNGNVLRGPATQPLTQFSTSVSGDTLSITK